LKRFEHFSRGLSASWVAALLTVLYGLVSVPLALCYLTIEEFGLLMLLIQIGGYFSLLELGLAGGTSRILIDYKDQPNSGDYGSVILTASLVFIAQGVLIAVTGIFSAHFIIDLANVPGPLVEPAIYMLRWLCVSFALTTTFRIYSSLLYANKRLDLLHILMGGNLIVSLFLMAIILALGGGLEGLVWVFVSQSVLGALIVVIACLKLRLLPIRGSWGRPTAARFRELFQFSKDVFLVNIGNQVLEASQLIIVTRTMGLAAAAIWSVSTKLFSLVYQLVTKIEGTAIVFFSEMMVRGENAKLAARFRQIYQLTAAIAVLGIAVAVAINGLFVSAWAKPALAWSLPLSMLLGVIVFLNVMTRCHSDLIVHSKNIAAFRYIYFFEAVAFVSLALWLSTRFGFYGVLGASLLCLLVFRATYTTWRVANYFGQPTQVLYWTWLRRPLAAALLLVPFVATTSSVANLASGPWPQLAVACVWVGTPSLIALFTFALPRDVTAEIALRLQQFSFSGKR